MSGNREASKARIELMKKQLRLAVVILALVLVKGFGGGAAAIGQTAGRIAAIRSLVQKTNQAIAESEQGPDTSTTFLIEFAVNKNLSPYPAVGIYKTVVKIYYTFGNREQDPYPNRLLKIINSTDRSDRNEYSEFVFDEARQLVFYFEKKDDIERRLYFGGGRLIRFQEGTRSLDLKDKEQAAIVANVLKEKASLVEIFHRSLRF